MNLNNYNKENSQKEIIDIIDCNGVKIGTAEKGLAHKIGLWHKAFHCWIFQEINNKYYVIYQKRGKLKSICPNYFDISAAGHYMASEGLEGGIREIKEEIGIEVSLDDLTFLGKKYDVYHNDGIFNCEICDVVLLKSNTPIASLKLAYPELEGVALVEVNDGLKLFGKKVQSITANAVIWSDKNQLWERTVIELNCDSFIARADNYFYKILTTIDMYSKGYHYINF